MLTEQQPKLAEAEVEQAMVSSSCFLLTEINREGLQSEKGRSPDRRLRCKPNRLQRQVSLEEPKEGPIPEHLQVLKCQKSITINPIGGMDNRMKLPGI